MRIERVLTRHCCCLFVSDFGLFVESSRRMGHCVCGRRQHSSGTWYYYMFLVVSLIDIGFPAT